MNNTFLSHTAAQASIPMNVDTAPSLRLLL